LLRQALLARCDVNLLQHRVAVANPRVHAPIFEVQVTNYCCGLLFYEVHLGCDEVDSLFRRPILSCERMTSCQVRSSDVLLDYGWGSLARRPVERVLTADEIRHCSDLAEHLGDRPGTPLS
jgi:hypothetical protein